MEWLDGATAATVGARFAGHNTIEGVLEWTTECTITECDAPRAFAWSVLDPELPGARWRFELQPIGRTVRLRQSVILGPGLSGTGAMIRKRPERESAILDRRLAQLKSAMQTTVDGIKHLAETGAANAGR